MIQVTDLTKSFGAKPALRGLSFSVAPGELYAMLGAKRNLGLVDCKNNCP